MIKEVLLAGVWMLASLSHAELPAYGWTGTNALAMPLPGEKTLRVLTPTILELTLITTKPSPSSAVTQWNFVGAEFSPRIPAPASFTIQSGPRKIAATKSGFKRRPLYAPLKQRDLRILNQLYLILSEPVKEGEKVTVKMDGSVFETSAHPLRFNPALHVNQVGYQPGFPKKAMVGYYLGSLGEMPLPVANGFKIVDASGKAVFTGKLIPRTDRGFTDASYQHVYEADFSNFNTPGKYRLAVDGLGASYPFQVHEGTMAAFARTYALGLYHQRCGTSNALPFTRHTHAACHTQPARVPTRSHKTAAEILARVTAPASGDERHRAPVIKDFSSSLYPFIREGELDASGGHHDAGDYSRYTINSAHLIHALTFSATYLPGAGELDNVGIPESGDGNSDLLQEAKWEADALVKMQDADGGFYFLLYPAERRYEDNVTPDKGDARIVWPKNTSATAAATAALAEIGSSPLFKRQFPEAADLYLRRAMRGWAFLERALKTHGSAGAYQMLTHYGHEFLHDDELAWAVAALFAATGEKKFEERLIRAFNPEGPETRRWSWWPMFEGWGNAARTYVFGTKGSRAKNHDASYRARCEKLIIETALNHVRFAANSAYGTSFPDPNKANRQAGWYFSSERAFDLTVAWQLNTDEKFKEAVLSNLNFEAGCNPVNVSYVTGLGWRRQREAVHQYAQNDHRILPPSGLPLGNVQAGFPFLHHYEKELGALTFPHDGAARGSYPFYDRWGDTFNTTTEFVVVDQARSLASLAFWMAQTPVKKQPWRAAAASIQKLPARLAVGESAVVQLQVAGLDPAEATIVWESRDREPEFASAFRLAPKNVGEQWVEAEMLWPDGRRAFALGGYEASASVDVPPHPLLSSNLAPTDRTLALFHFDGGFTNEVKDGTLSRAGSAELDASNLSWMRERKGAALRVQDLGDHARGELELQIPPDATELRLQAMIYLNSFKAYNRTNANIISLSEDWNSSIALIENLYEGPMIKGGTAFSLGSTVLTNAIRPGKWHLLELTAGTDRYEARVDGKIIGSIPRGELANWGRKKAVLELGNFDGYIDEVLIETR